MENLELAIGCSSAIGGLASYIGKNEINEIFEITVISKSCTMF